MEIASNGQVLLSSSSLSSENGASQPLDGMSFVAGSQTKIKFTQAKLLDGWNYGGGGSAQPGYAIDSLGVVHLRGGLATGSSDAAAFVLPQALRPSHPMWLPMYTYNGTEGSLVIASNGTVTPIGSEVSTYSSLDGISFAAGSSTKIRFTDAQLKSPPFQDGGQGSARPGYAKDSLGVVYLRGGLRGGGNHLAFTLPRALRPSHDLTFPIYSFNGTESVLQILNDGSVVPQPHGSSAKGYMSLDGISFVAGQ